MNCSSTSFRITVIIGFLLLSFSGFTQNAVDSLLDVVNQDRANAETYNQLAQEYWFIDMHQSKEYAEKALLLARKDKDEVQEGFAYNRLGTAFMYLRNLDSATVYYNRSANMFRRLELYTELAGATACCARIFESKLEYDSALVKYSESLKIFEKAEKSEYYVQTVMVVGGLYSRLGDFRNAQKYFDLALENKSFLKPYDQISLYNKIGINYQNLGDFPNAMNYFEDAFKACDLSDDNIALASTYVNTGNLYIAWGKKNAALDYLKKGLEVSKATGIEYYRQTILLLMADIYFDLGQFEKARASYTDLLDSIGETKDVFNEGKAYSGLAKVVAREHHYLEAIGYSLKALDLFKETKRPGNIANTHVQLAGNYLSLAVLDKAKQHLDSAAIIVHTNSLKELEAQVMLLRARYNNVANKGLNSHKFYEKYILLKDSLFAEQNQELLAKFQVELDNLEKDYQLKEAQNLNTLKEVELNQKRKQITYITIISLLLLAGFVVFAIMYVRKQRANRLLFLKNKELIEEYNKPAKKAEGIEISESLQNEIIQKLTAELEENKIHLRNDLSLHTLSKLLGTNSSYLSKIIQSYYNTNFSAYLNKCRILEAQKMILDKNYNHYTIDAISQECGYNSKSTFNKAFKEYTGLTPKEYKRQDTL